MSAITAHAETVGIILAAGHGRRMRSRIPKPLHTLAGRELIRYSVDLLHNCDIKNAVVVASPGNVEAIAAVLGDTVHYAVQPEAGGTADAVSHALAALDSVPNTVAVMSADTPLVRTKSLRKLLNEHASRPGCRMTILTAPDAFGPDLGHVQRATGDGAACVGQVAAIAEARDRDEDAVGPVEVNTGVYCFDGAWLSQNIGHVPRSHSGEYYLTALVAMAADSGAEALAAPFACPDEAMGVNDRQQLAAVSTVLRDRINSKWMMEGVTIIDTATTYIDEAVAIGRDTIIQPNTMLVGPTTIGEDCEIGPNSVLRDSNIGRQLPGHRRRRHGRIVRDGRPYVSIGPFSHLRPAGNTWSRASIIGNYVEVKESRVKAPVRRLWALRLPRRRRPSEPRVNIGAGTDHLQLRREVDKHQTVVEDDRAFIGCDTMLVAPVTVWADGFNHRRGGGCYQATSRPLD